MEASSLQVCAPLQVDDPQQLLPKLPKPKDLQPFPSQLTLRFLGHEAKVRCAHPPKHPPPPLRGLVRQQCAPFLSCVHHDDKDSCPGSKFARISLNSHPHAGAIRSTDGSIHWPGIWQVTSVAPDHTGQWLASSSADGTVRLWEVGSGRCVRVWQLGAPVGCVAWCPNPALRILSAVADKTAVLVWSGAAALYSGNNCRYLTSASHPGEGRASLYVCTTCADGT